jgi:hypothetical protein
VVTPFSPVLGLPAATVRPVAQRTVKRRVRSRVRPVVRRQHRQSRVVLATRAGWLPRGAAVWIYQWSATERGNARAVLARARHYGLSALFVRTGSTVDGFTGAKPLSALLRLAGRHDPAIVAWDYPVLADPSADAARLAEAAWFGRGHRGIARVAAVAPDIEDPSLTAGAVDTYLRHLRALLPPGVPILATVPWPSGLWPSFPYGVISGYANAFLPMTYWYSRSAYWVTLDSIQRLAHYGKPIFPVGQGYDSRLDDPLAPPSHPWSELAEFLAAARAGHVSGISLWSWQLAGNAQWHTLVDAAKVFTSHGQ